MTTQSEIADQLLAEAAALDREIEEIDMLVAQAKTEATRHETRRLAATDRLATLTSTATVKEVVDLANQAVILTRRAALMDAQLEILEGKKRSAARLKESIRAGAGKVQSIGARGPSGDAGEAGPDSPGEDDIGEMPPAVSRLVLSAQEDLRREIARAMHDGPAQSLTNIVLQAEIVERLVGRDPKLAADEVRELVAMVQQTLEATKTFIFDVRPMVLDDLGLVPTLRRSARDRGQRAGIAVEFESVGLDRRLPAETESGVFRIADEALAAYLAVKPDRATLGIDWGESLVLTVRAERAPKTVQASDLPEDTEGLPPALAEMVADRRRQHDTNVERARVAAQVKLPARLVRELKQRAATLGIELEVLEDGGCLRLSAPMADAPAMPEPA
ncbi:MAG: histidine kinase [Chloroflexota bacterium]